MTDSILPDDLANHLVDGTADISSLPTEFRGVAEVFAAAHQPATGAELAGMASVVQQISAAVAPPAAANAGAKTTGVISMFGTRITKRAAVVVGATLLFAGTAAAAASGVLPSTFSSPERHSTPELTLESSSSEAAEQSSSDDQSTSSSELEVESESKSLDDSTSTSFPEADFGHCTAWNSGTTKNTDTPEFGTLATEASEAGKSIDDYCGEVLAAHDAMDDHGADAGDDSADDATDDKGDDSVTSNSTGTSVDDASGKNSGKNGGGHGADDPATSVSTEGAVTVASASVPDNSPAPVVSVDDGSQSGKGGKNKGGDTSTSNP